MTELSSDGADPYPDEMAYLRDELRRHDCRLRMEVDRFEGPIDQFGPLYISEEEVRTLLAEPESSPRPTGVPVAEELEAWAARIRERRLATQAAGRELRFDALVERLDLEKYDRELLLAALAPELAGRYATIYAYLQDDATRTLATVDFLVGLLGDGGDRLTRRSAFGEDAPLIRHGLVQLEGNGPRTRRTVRPDERIVGYLLSDPGLDPALERIATLTRDLEPMGVSRDRIEALAASGTVQSDPPPIVALYGPEGAGKWEAVRLLASRPDRPLLTIDADRLPPDSPALIDRLMRELRLLDATVHVDGLGTVEARLSRDFLGRLDRLDAPVFLTDTVEPPRLVRVAVDEHVVLPVELPRPDYLQRRERWRAVSDLPDGVDPDIIAGTYRLTGGAIDNAIERARAEANLAGEELSAEHVYRACRAQSGDELGDLAKRIELGYDWNDIVLPADTERRLRELAARLAEQGTVFDEWGFEAASSRGTGVVGLFSGPSGTGKTMAAEVVANDAELDLYRVDLSSVVSKYVGETESNLGRVFDAAADTDAALLFDEADALFGERSEVSDSQDRYANIEVDYLLQRIEDHDGAVLLTSNLEANIDDAFLRRIHVSVEFPTPDRNARRRIWEGVFPPNAPTTDIDVDYLARFELSGGSVRNVALGAAFLAADNDEPIGMAHIVRALELELEKIGRLIEPERFGAYRDYLE